MLTTTRKPRLIKFQFTARCGEESIPLEVNLPYKPGKQTQRARRVAVGELLAILEIEEATVKATGDDLVTVSTTTHVWAIAEGGAANERRGGV